MISIKLPCNFIEIVLRNGCSSVNLLHIFRTPFDKDTYGGLFLALSIRGLKSIADLIKFNKLDLLCNTSDFLGGTY